MSNLERKEHHSQYRYCSCCFKPPLDSRSTPTPTGSFSGFFDRSREEQVIPSLLRTLYLKVVHTLGQQYTVDKVVDYLNHSFVVVGMVRRFLAY